MVGGDIHPGPIRSGHRRAVIPIVSEPISREALGLSVGHVEITDPRILFTRRLASFRSWIMAPGLKDSS